MCVKLGKLTNVHCDQEEHDSFCARTDAAYVMGTRVVINFKLNMLGFPVVICIFNCHSFGIHVCMFLVCSVRCTIF